MDKNEKLLKAISATTPWGDETVEFVFDITRSYDTTIEICQTASALCLRPEEMAVNRKREEPKECPTLPSNPPYARPSDIYRDEPKAPTQEEAADEYLKHGTAVIAYGNVLLHKDEIESFQRRAFIAGRQSADIPPESTDVK